MGRGIATLRDGSHNTHSRHRNRLHARGISEIPSAGTSTEWTSKSSIYIFDVRTLIMSRCPNPPKTANQTALRPLTTAIKPYIGLSRAFHTGQLQTLNAEISVGSQTWDEVG